MMKTFANAIAVVTGAGSGIGRAVACEFASRGCDLALADIDEAGLAQTRAALPGNRRVTTSRVDVAALADMTRLRDEVARDFGRVSVLVNNAGVALYGRFEDLSVADLQWIMGINFWVRFTAANCFCRCFCENRPPISSRFPVCSES